MKLTTSKLKSAAPGMGITLTIAFIAFLASSMHPSFDALVISVIFGMLVANMLDDRKIIEEGIEFALKIFLPIGIALYGFQLNILDAELKVIPGVLLVFALMFSVSYFISRGIGLDRPLSVLIGTGMSVCGASAIIVIAPIIHARKEDTSISVLSVITVGLTGMLAYRIIAGMSGMDVGDYAFLTGATLPMLGQVKVASAAMGQQSLDMALQYKLVRLSALAVIAIAGLVFSGRREGRFHVPWFMIAFFVFAVAVNMSDTVAGLGSLVKPISKVSLSLALAAIGLSIDFDSVTEKGAAPLVSAFLAWGIIALTVYLVLSIVIS